MEKFFEIAKSRWSRGFEKATAAIFFSPVNDRPPCQHALILRKLAIASFIQPVIFHRRKSTMETHALDEPGDERVHRINFA